MSSIASLGIGSGMDLNGLLDKLAAAENAPLAAIRKQQSGVNARISAYGSLQSLLGTLQTAARKLADAGFVNALKASSSASSAVGASVSGKAVAGKYEVSVTQLAQAQSLVTAGVADPQAPIGAAGATQLTFAFGRVTGELDAGTGTYRPGASFEANAARPAVSFGIDGSTTLEGLRDQINRTAGLGVTASIVHDGSAHRLLLTGMQTGQASSLHIDVNGDAQLAALLSQDPAGRQSLRQTVAAADAQLVVNGLAFTSPGNVLATSIQGLRLDLQQTGTAVVTVQQDRSAVESALGDLVDAYNRLQARLVELTRYDLGKKSGAALVGDAAPRQIESRLRSVLTEAAADGLRGLSELGVAFQKDGTLGFDRGRFASVLAADPEGVARLLAGGRDVGMGLAGKLAAASEAFGLTGGALKLATDGANATLRRLGQEADSTQARIDAKLARYRKQFQQLDAMLTGMTSTSNYLTQQFNATRNK